jgi:polysaccharide deacetylase family protein (PEP-CTERM system associated)
MILISVDIESWVHRPVFNIPSYAQTKELDAGNVLEASRIILEIFKKYQTKATFFILGTVAEWYPELIKDIKSEGHEIGIHGYTHKGLNAHNKISFDNEIKKTVSILKNHGVEPRGYRSPFFTRSDFLYEILSKHGIIYDSSVFPVKTPLYNGTSYSCRPFIIDRGIIEIPCSVLKIGKIRIPVGGFYLRLFGEHLNCLFLKKIEERNGIAVLYFHPWEIMNIPKIIRFENDKTVKLSFLKKRFAYYKLPMLNKIEYLLKKIRFTNFEEAIKSINEELLG